MIIKYRANYARSEITSVECTKETELSIWMLQNGFESRALKKAPSISYFDTWTEAQAWMHAKAQSEKIKRYAEHEEARKKAELICSMREPQNA
jgi:hypothetical protein